MSATPVAPERTKGPTKEFYLRKDKDSPLWGPLSYYDAEYQGRQLTREAARTGKGDISIELVTIVGEREGDPPRPPEIRVVCVFLAGRKTMGGSLAQYNSEHGRT